MIPLRIRATLALGLLVGGVSSAGAQAPNDTTLLGAWDAEVYRLASGETHAVTGHIFFTQHDWTVLFFVVDDDGEPRRGSGEGGTYTLRGTRLAFTHHYHLSTGQAMPGLPASDLRMMAGDEGTGPPEECTIEIESDRLTIFFPSGNSMTFRQRP